MACCAQALSRSVPVSVTATSSRSTCAPHRAWPATFSNVSYGFHASWTAMPVKNGSTPAAFMPSLPRLACTVTSTCFPQDAEWTQASFPAVRNPVSSKCATSAPARYSVIAFRAGASSPAVFLAAAASAPGDGAHPNISASARQARSRDRNWPCHR